MFVNFSNHSSSLWDNVQLAAAKEYGDIIDLPFPLVMPQSSEKDITQMCSDFTEKIISLKPTAVLCQGEFTLSFAVITALLTMGITVVAACSQRQTTTKIIDGKTIKTAEFRFVQFRKYGGDK